jgi:integrative and conjugative element protein (TIGR02256 family)
VLVVEAVEVWMAHEALQVMVDDGSKWAPEETGGVLVGYWVHDRQAVVTTAVDAGPNSVHSVSGFHPDAKYQERRIAELYEQSGRYHIYLGDWHTHPLGGIGLSRTDRRTMRRIAGSVSARCRSPLMLILANSMEWKTAAWSTTRRHRRLQPALAVVRTYG